MKPAHFPAAPAKRTPPRASFDQRTGDNFPRSSYRHNAGLLGAVTETKKTKTMLRQFRNVIFPASRATFARAEIEQFVSVTGDPDAVEKVAEALDKEAVANPLADRKLASEDLRICARITLAETGKPVWPIYTHAANGNTAKVLLHGLAVANPGALAVLDYNVAGSVARVEFQGDEVREFTLFDNFVWHQIRPGRFVHPSALVVLDIEKPRPIERLSEQHFSPRRPSIA